MQFILENFKLVNYILTYKIIPETPEIPVEFRVYSYLFVQLKKLTQKLFEEILCNNFSYLSLLQKEMYFFF